jgi:D-alanine transaminase
MQELATRNGITEGLVYLQVTRGAGRARLRLSPSMVTPTVFAFARPKKLSDDPNASRRAGARGARHPLAAL